MQHLEILCFKNILGWKFLGKYHTASNRVNWEKGIILAHRFYFLITQAFLTWRKILCWSFTQFYLRKTSQKFWSSVFTKFKRVWALIEKRKTEPLWLWLGAFIVGILRTSLYLTLAWIEKHCSKVFSSLFHKLVECVSELYEFRRGVTSLRVRLVTCVLQVVTVSVTL